LNSGFDIELVKHISENVSIPVIASSGAGKVEHFSEVFEKTDMEAALAAGIFHREEVPIEAVKDHMKDEGIETHYKYYQYQYTLKKALPT
jgi:glutamine amidotransferase/cyclase